MHVAIGLRLCGCQVLTSPVIPSQPKNTDTTKLRCQKPPVSSRPSSLVSSPSHPPPDRDFLLTHAAGGLDNAVTKEILHAAFLPFGGITEVQLPRDERSTEPHRGFGYVEFEEPADAVAAIDNMDQCMLGGRVLNVAQAKPQKEGTVLGSKVAVWEQVWVYLREGREREGDWWCVGEADFCVGELVGETRG